LQILWVNLVTDGLPGLALAVEPAERSTMQRPPYSTSRPVIDGAMWRDIVWVGLVMAAISLAAGAWIAGGAAEDEAYWRTVVFTVLTLAQMGNVLAVRSTRDSLFRIGLSSNTPLLLAVLLTFVLQLLVVYAPPLQAVFATRPLSLGDLALCVAFSSLLFWAIEAKKLLTAWLRTRCRVT
ncbi:MAG: cation transporting ATPase C-terminal domain-containing protein, partial [Planctomycetales bacterium]|nr:cation transporting ATPase C-terminal domain-containing protein [Planctomycetales bacterium]